MNKTNLLVDLSIFTAFFIGMDPTLTGIPIHEWLSLALAAAAIAHILLHWKWITTIGVAYFKKLFHNSRLKFALDVLLFISFTCLMMSGIWISRSILPVFGMAETKSLTWEGIHSTSANLTLIIIAIHLALNWGWLVTMTKKYLITPLKRPPQPRRQPAAVKVKASAEKQELT